ncbi:MAG: hypothetical protein AAF960_06325 [Bacteroidota bacterium]
MKLFFTTTLLALTTLLSAQTVTFEPATSIMNDNVVASLDGMFFAADAYVEVNNEFNLDFVAGDYFGDIVISYDLNTSSEVILEVEKEGARALELVNEAQEGGAKKVLWDENVGSGQYTIRLIVGQKVETKTVNLSY